MKCSARSKGGPLDAVIAKLTGGQPGAAFSCPVRRRARGQHVGRPKALDSDRAALARRMHSSGEPVKTIAETLPIGPGRPRRVGMHYGSRFLLFSYRLRPIEQR